MTTHLVDGSLSSNHCPKIYVACLASYNNGILYGGWIDAGQSVEEIEQQIKKLLANSPMPNAEEYAFHDYEGFYSLQIDEYEAIEEIYQKAQFVLEHGELGAELVACYPGDLDYARETLRDYYQGEYDSELDYATQLFNDIFLSTVPKNVQYYIDYESFCRDLFINDCLSIEVGGKCHVFNQH